MVSLQQAWKAIGIDMKTQKMDRATLEDRMYNKRDFDAYIWWDGYNFEPMPSTSTWGSGPDLLTGFSSPDVDALLKTILGNPDQAIRKSAIWELAQKASEQVWMIPLYFNMGCFAMRDYVKGVPKPSAADFNNSAILYQVEKLYIDKGK